jgi:hypothetical protein
MGTVANRHADELLLGKMLAPPPLEQARASLDFWRQRRSGLPFYRLRDRREADEMIRRWRTRLAAAERARFGTGLFGQIRRLLAVEQRSWPIWQERTLVAFAWRVVPRRLALVALAALGAVLVSLVAIGLGVIVLVLQAA